MSQFYNYCVISTDEKIASCLATYLEEGSNGKFKSHSPTGGRLPSLATDILFIDIDTADMSFVAAMGRQTQLVFISSTEDYLLPALRAGATDYLLKPLTDRKLHALRRRLICRCADQDSAVNNGVIRVRADRLERIIKIRDIRYLESLREYVIIHLLDGEKIMTLISMSKLLQSLPQELFTRIHRSYTVANCAVTAFSNQYVRVGERQLRIGGSYLVAVRRVLG